jgi:hypothetical protein
MSVVESIGCALSELRTPHQIIARLDEVMFQAKKATQIIYQARTDHLRAKHAYLREFKQAKLEAKGTVSDREDQAQIDNWALFQVMEIAEAALLHAREMRRDLEDELSKLQTEARLVRDEMALTR